MLSSVAWGAVGYVHEASGTAQMQTGSGPARNIQAGDTFDPGTTFRTSGNGNVVVKFEDGQLAALRPNTVFRVDQYSYNPKSPSTGQSAITLVQGAMRFVTGIIGATNRNQVRFQAASATIGIRGTDVTVVVDPVSQSVIAAIAAGAIAFQTAAGTINVAAGQYSSAGVGQTPSQAAPIAAAPAVVQAVVTALAAAPIPINTPVVVNSAARAAVAVATAREAQVAAAKDPGNATLQGDAKVAVQAAVAAAQTAIAEAQVAFTTAVQAGATAPAPPSTPVQGLQPVPTPAPVPDAAVLLPPVTTPPPTICTGSSC